MIEIIAGVVVLLTIGVILGNLVAHIIVAIFFSDDNEGDK